MWALVDTVEHTTELQWWSVDGMAGIALVSLPGTSLSHEQWRLIRNQFENMGIVPKLLNDR